MGENFIEWGLGRLALELEPKIITKIVTISEVDNLYNSMFIYRTRKIMVHLSSYLTLYMDAIFFFI